MKLAPGQALSVLLWQDEAIAAMPAARLAMAGGLAQLEWSREILARRLALSPVQYPPEAGLQPANGRAFDGLHGFLADSLPEGWGALLMRRRLAAMQVQWDALNAIDRLALVGRHGRGALVFEPATTPAQDLDTLDLDLLAEQSRRILLGEESALAATLAELGGASGGARPKIHVGFNPEGGACIADGEVAEGYAPWIVKFPATADPEDIGPIEQAYAEMARAAGIVMSETRLIASKTGPGYFATRRFDRPALGKRLPMVSLSGAIEAPADVPGAIDYDMFLRATRHITRDVRDVEQAFARMIFNVLACNRDDHSRQHAYLMDERGEWRLAPAYDLTYSAGPGGEHYLAVGPEGRNPTRAHVAQVAKAHGIAEARAEAVVEQVRDAIARWPTFADACGVRSSSRQIINARLEQIARIFDA